MFYYLFISIFDIKDKLDEGIVEKIKNKINYEIIEEEE